MSIPRLRTSSFACIQAFACALAISGTALGAAAGICNALSLEIKTIRPNFAFSFPVSNND
jgi:hypothetical protein